MRKSPFYLLVASVMPWALSLPAEAVPEIGIFSCGTGAKAEAVRIPGTRGQGVAGSESWVRLTSSDTGRAGIAINSINDERRSPQLLVAALRGNTAVLQKTTVVLCLEGNDVRNRRPILISFKRAASDLVVTEVNGAKFISVLRSQIDPPPFVGSDFRLKRIVITRSSDSGESTLETGLVTFDTEKPSDIDPDNLGCLGDSNCSLSPAPFLRSKINALKQRVRD